MRVTPGGIYIPDYLAPNPIVNAGLNLWSEATSFASIADGTWTADNWIYNKAGAVIHDASRSTDVPSPGALMAVAPYSLLLDVTTADGSIEAGDYCTISTRIEGFNYQGYAQQVCALSFWVKASKTGIHCVFCRNAGNNRSLVLEYPILTADTWEYKTLVLPASPSAGTWDYTSGRGLQIGWTLAAGTTFQAPAGAWAAGDFKSSANQVNELDSTANNFRIWGPMLVRGSQAVPLIPVPYWLEQLRALRYYELIQSAGSLFPFAQGYMTTTTLANIILSYVPKRATPTVTYDSTPSNYQVLVSGGAFDCSAVTTVAGPYTDRVLIQATSGTALTAGFGVALAGKNATPFIKIASRIP